VIRSRQNTLLKRIENLLRIQAHLPILEKALLQAEAADTAAPGAVFLDEKAEVRYETVPFRPARTKGGAGAHADLLRTGLEIFRKTLARQGTASLIPAGFLFDSFEAFAGAEPMPASCVVFDTWNGRRVRGEGPFVCTFTKGCGFGTQEAARRMQAFAAQWKLAMKGPVFYILICNELCVQAPEEFTFMVSAAVTPLREEA